MANRERGEYRLALAGDVYVLRLTIAAICEMEDQLGRPFASITAGLQQARISDLRALLWAALQDRHGRQFPLMDSVGALIDRLGGVPIIRKALQPFLKLNAQPVRFQRAGKGKAVKPPVESDIWRKLYIELRAGGLPADRFWDLSLRELWAEVDVLREQHRNRAQFAFLVEWMARQDKISSKTIDEVAPREQIIRRQTYDEQRAVIENLAGSLGAPLQRIPWKPPAKVA